MSIPSCQTCYSTLLPSHLARAHYTPCCNSPICDRCLALNPRLREYDPCLRCGDVRSASGSSRVRIGAASETAEEQRRQDAVREANQFTIGDDDEDEVLFEAEEVGSRPPSYKEGQGPVLDRPEEPTDSRIGDKEAEVEMEVVEVTHPVGRGDTLMSVARKYAADPHDLLTLNSLPPSALNSNPRILQTRRTLVISRRLLPRGSIPPPIIDSSDILSPEEKEKRDAERRLKRFQLLTKTTDAGVGKAYLALAGEGEDEHALESGSGEVLEKNGQSGKKVRRSEGKEGRALEAYFEDEEWEGEVGRAERVKEGGRWVVVGRGVGSGSGSGMKSMKA